MALLISTAVLTIAAVLSGILAGGVSPGAE